MSNRGTAFTWLYVSEVGRSWLFWLLAGLIIAIVVGIVRRRQLTQQGRVGSTYRGLHPPFCWWRWWATSSPGPRLRSPTMWPTNFVAVMRHAFRGHKRRRRLHRWRGSVVGLRTGDAAGRGRRRTGVNDHRRRR
ncbi:MAG: hypothetical protein R2856_06695 [Caldilineaceae bacterium]